MIQIRYASRVDCEQIYQLITELEGSSLNKENFTKIYLSNLLFPSIFYFVAYQDEKIIGFISIHIQKLLHHVTEIAEIQEFIVDENYRQMGIGKLLFAKAIEVAKENDCTQLEVCCNRSRKNSCAFYLQCGMIKSHFKFCLPQ